MVSEKKSHYKSLGAIIHWGVASLDPRGLVGRKYVGNHLTVIYTKYISCGLHGFRVKNFKDFFCIIQLGSLSPYLVKVIY